jgi:signal transduction histidine kinase
MSTLDSVLQLSELEAGTKKLPRERVNLNEVAREVTQSLRPSAEEKSIALDLDLPEHPAAGTWNEAALTRILKNLVENAIKFTPEGETVTVRSRLADGDGILEVADTGVGISEEALPSIFEAFKQESKGLDREYEGAGLGLSIVKRLVDLFEGTIEVQSERGEGSQFTIRLPTGAE